MIGIVTTYKNRPNYTTITYATLREALKNFDGEVDLYFYDDASTVPVPPIVDEMRQASGVRGFFRHKNETGLGAEHGNVDSITKCFEKFPDITHVLVLDNDMCVHPFALNAIKKMIEDIPNLGCGSIFNSNVFPEKEIVKERYVVKDVNPGNGSVIQREAWFWHLSVSTPKLDKNPKQPGWDWNLSAWMKDSGGKWNVYSTLQSYVEHIGTSGTNVSDAFMTRARRFREKAEICLDKTDPIDVLMPVKDLNDSSLERMRWCIKSLQGSTVKFRLCISDTSKVSMLETLKNIIEFPFEYTWEEGRGLFNRSRTVNNGVRHLVKSDPFVVMDTDIIVPNNYLEKFIRYHQDIGTFVVGRLAYLKEGHPWSVDWGAYQKCEINFYYNSGFFICSLDLFKRINGFDERYNGWGAEDDDLNVRMTVATNGKIRKLEGMELTCWHLFHPRKDTVEKDACEENRKIYWENKAKYETGVSPVNSVQGLKGI